ncbi:benzoylformate decarboxylase [Saccharothrix syringae]|uniref:Benzoylformate decarboxylase n=1 Tax=Saccharothrix syringae TaxID=103733 RepID=A0A5Q0H5E3_SACSY|nr:benzoylformate decarboxylase [Saccharothrix syringae]QFZ21164.1 benzoylformate decarboxylase [Saccharothrix syringae]
MDEDTAVEQGRTVRDATRDLLRALGLTTVFGNPGTTEVAFLTDWPDDFRYVLGLQESAVVAMADGYAHAARRPVLVNLHSAGGLGHGLGHVFTAHRNRTPMIVLAGQQVRSLLPDDPFLGATDAVDFPKPYVKWSCEPARAQDVPAAIARAYYMATQAPQGPVFVSVPADDWDAEAGPPVPVRPRVPGFAPDPRVLDELVTALDVAQRPGIVAGPAVDEDGAVPELVALAERIGAGVWASGVSARCSFPEDHPLFRGFLNPERRATAAALAEHDLVVVLGAPAFTYHVYRGESDLPLPPLFLISDDDGVLARARHGVGLRATAKLALTALTGRVRRVDRPLPVPRPRPPRPAETNPISAGQVYSLLAELVPDDAIVVEETPSHRSLLHDHLPITATDTGFLTTASGALGYGLPAAVGAALARPDRKVVAVIGDGSSMYGIQALWTAVRERAAVAFVILDNSRYSAVHTLGAAAGGRNLPGVDLGGLDFVALAEGMGCAARAVTDPAGLKDALADALAADEPRLVHVRIDPNPPAMY